MLTHLASLRYALSQLLVGSEGTLGVITAAALHAPRAPASTVGALLCCAGFDDVLRVRDAAERGLGETLAALEVMDAAAYGAGLGGGASPVAEAPFYVLAEAAGANPRHDGEKMEAFAAAALDSGAAADAALALDGARLARLWAIREACPVALNAGADHYLYKYDLSLPAESFYAVVDAARDRLAPLGGVRVAAWGHLADGNVSLSAGCV